MIAKRQLGNITLLNVTIERKIITFKSLDQICNNYFQMGVWTIQEFKTKSSFDRRPSNYHGKLYLDRTKIQGHEYSRNIDMNK
jgi:hypothetical protein